ncbi:MAG: hypothetical protein WC612_02200 [Bdellovibrionales bacterium]|jgi:hypothetical protein
MSSYGNDFEKKQKSGTKKLYTQIILFGLGGSLLFGVGTSVLVGSFLKAAGEVAAPLVKNKFTACLRDHGINDLYYSLEKSKENQVVLIDNLTGAEALYDFSRTPASLTTTEKGKIDYDKLPKKDRDHFRDVNACNQLGPIVLLLK